MGRTFCVVVEKSFMDRLWAVISDKKALHFKSKTSRGKWSSFRRLIQTACLAHSQSFTCPDQVHKTRSIYHYWRKSRIVHLCHTAHPHYITLFLHYIEHSSLLILHSAPISYWNIVSVAWFMQFFYRCMNVHTETKWIKKNT